MDVETCQPQTATLLERLGLRTDAGLRASLEDAALRIGPNIPSVLARAIAEPDGGPTLDLLAQRMSVQESTFFRHPAHFELLERVVFPALKACGRKGLRLLSAGCARGEEPYSLAISAIRAWPSGDHSVLALDVSTEAIAALGRGVYRPWSFRGVEPSALSPWVRPVEGGYEVSSAIKALVRGVRGYLQALPGEVIRCAPYDVILCRNVLIYLMLEVGRRVVATLADLLAPDGICLVGPADHEACSGQQSVLLEGGVYGYRRGPAAAPLVWATRLAPVPPEPQAPIVLPDRVLPPAPHSPYLEHQALLREGRAQRDGGLHEAALRTFDRAIELRPDDPEAYVEQAVLLDERGLGQASKGLLERALYLDACFAPAVMLLARLHLKSGQGVRARRLVEQLDEALAQLPAEAEVRGWERMTAGALRRSCRTILDARAEEGA